MKKLKTIKKDLTLHDFPIIYRWNDNDGWYKSGIRWDDCEKIMGKQMYKRFIKHMYGSTYGQDGPYSWDVESFLNGIPNFD